LVTNTTAGRRPERRPQSHSPRRSWPPSRIFRSSSARDPLQRKTSR
jgi:hypothetical protein